MRIRILDRFIGAPSIQITVVKGLITVLANQCSCYCHTVPDGRRLPILYSSRVVFDCFLTQCPRRLPARCNKKNWPRKNRYTQQDPLFRMHYIVWHRCLSTTHPQTHHCSLCFRTDSRLLLRRLWFQGQCFGSRQLFYIWYFVCTPHSAAEVSY